MRIAAPYDQPHGTSEKGHGTMRRRALSRTPNRHRGLFRPPFRDELFPLLAIFAERSLLLLSRSASYFLSFLLLLFFVAIGSS